MIPLIGIGGYAGSGKDTAARILVKEFGFKRLAFGDKVKEAALALNPLVGYEEEYVPFCDVWGDEDPDAEWRLGGFTPVRLADLVERVGWDEAKKDLEVRRTLQRLGTEVGRDFFGNEIWISLVERIMKNDFFAEKEGPVVISDVRFPNEGTWIKQSGTRTFVCKPTGLLVWIHRPGHNPPNSHSSESDVIREMADEEWVNGGTLAEFERFVRERMSVYA